MSVRVSCLRVSAIFERVWEKKRKRVYCKYYFLSMYKSVSVGSHLREERPLLSLLLKAVSHQPLHGLWTVAADLAEVRGQVTSSHHEYDLWNRKNES